MGFFSAIPATAKGGPPIHLSKHQIPILHPQSSVGFSSKRVLHIFLDPFQSPQPTSALPFLLTHGEKEDRNRGKQLTKNQVDKPGARDSDLTDLEMGFYFLKASGEYVTQPGQEPLGL